MTSGELIDATRAWTHLLDAYDKLAAARDQDTITDAEAEALNDAMDMVERIGDRIYRGYIKPGRES